MVSPGRVARVLAVAAARHVVERVALDDAGRQRPDEAAGAPGHADGVLIHPGRAKEHSELVLRGRALRREEVDGARANHRRRVAFECKPSVLRPFQRRLYELRNERETLDWLNERVTRFFRASLGHNNSSPSETR